MNQEKKTSTYKRLRTTLKKGGVLFLLDLINGEILQHGNQALVPSDSVCTLLLKSKLNSHDSFLEPWERMIKIREKNLETRKV